MKQHQSDRGSSIKTFVIDTNVLIHRSDAILSFRDNEIVLPLWVLEELDQLKTDRGERGRNARAAIRFLDGVSSNGDIQEGVKLENGSILRVVLTHAAEVPADLKQDRADNKIILTAYQLMQQGRRVFFVSKDINARVKAAAVGVKAVDYEKQKFKISKLYNGCREMTASGEQVQHLVEDGRLDWSEELTANEFLALREKGDSTLYLARWQDSEKKLQHIPSSVGAVQGIQPLNPRQRMAFNLLLDDAVPLVTLVGKAGTGKTLLALASGLRKVLGERVYARVLIARPIIPMGKDIGYLPGAKDEKMSHWMQPLFDNLEYILSVQEQQGFKSVEQMMSSKVIEIEALTYIRGRSLPKQYIIIDEAQNLSPHEVKTIVSRAGEGTKVILTGDPYQIDSPYLDADSNGLTYLVEMLKGDPLFGHITLDKSERSPLAELAAEKL